MGLRVAVVGLSPSTHELAPWKDDAWEKWGLPWDASWPYFSRCFEMHDMRLLKGPHSGRERGYFEKLKACEGLYMQEASKLLNARAYPFDDVAKTIGAYYFNSSIAYAMALAIHEGAEEIGIYGVDMKGDDEYGYQKPNMEYLVGLARGRGINVLIPDESPLCKFQPSGIKFYDHSPTYVDRYGWLG